MRSSTVRMRCPWATQLGRRKHLVQCINDGLLVRCQGFHGSNSFGFGHTKGLGKVQLILVMFKCANCTLVDEVVTIGEIRLLLSSWRHRPLFDNVMLYENFVEWLAHCEQLHPLRLTCGSGPRP
jgi:hypothetical protein